MKNATRYARLFLCVLIMLVALIAPATTGFSPAKAAGNGNQRNEIDTSSFMPVWSESFLDAQPAGKDDFRDVLARHVWDLKIADNTQSGNMSVTRSMEDILAEDLGQDSGSGYGKLTEMARNGYADLGTKVANASVTNAASYRSAPQVANNWGNYPGYGGNGSSDDNAYTTVPPVIDPGTGGGTDPGGNGGGGGDGGGGGTIPDNPVVPAPAALILAGIGVGIVRVFKIGFE